MGDRVEDTIDKVLASPKERDVTRITALDVVDEMYAGPLRSTKKEINEYLRGLVGKGELRMARARRYENVVVFGFAELVGQGG